MESASRKVGPIRKTLRWCRWMGGGLVLLLAFGLVYLNQIGVPEWMKRPILAQLRERGLDLEFSRMRVRLTRGLVAEDVNLERTRQDAGEVFHAGEVQLKLRWSSMLELRPPEVEALTLEDGKVTLPLPTGPGLPPYLFDIDGVQARLRFVSADLWELEELFATSHGGAFHAHGILTNAMALRSRKASRPPAAATPPAWRRHLLEVARWLDRTRFETPPVVHVAFTADARNPARTTGEFRLNSSGALTPLGDFDGVELLVEVEPGAGVETTRAEVGLKADRAVTRWGGFDALSLVLGADWMGTNPVPDRLELQLGSTRATSRWASVDNLELTASVHAARLPAGVAAPWRWPRTNAPWAFRSEALPGFESAIRLRAVDVVVQTRTNPVTLAGVEALLLASHTTSDWRSLRMALEMDGATSVWSTVPGLQLDLALTPREDPPEAGPGWSFWAPLSHVEAWLAASVGPAQLPRLSIDGADFGLVWSAPQLMVGPFEGRLGGGEIRGAAELDVATRRAVATVASTADPHAVSPWMGPKAREQIAQYGWREEALPRLSGEVGITLPGWGVPGAEERQAILRSVTLDAWMDVTNATFRGLACDTATGRLTYTNRYWRIGPLDIRRPEGRLEFTYENDEYTKDYRFRLDSGIDPLIVKALVEDAKVRRELDRIELPVPPRVTGEVWGRWRSPERVGARVHVTLTNATVRGEPIQWADGDVEYTNRVVTFLGVRARSDGDAEIPGALLDFNTRRLTFTNARATIPVHRVTRLISARTAAFMEAYRFPQPPRSRVDGTVALGGFEGTDIRFDVEADEFGWWRLRATNVSGRIRLLDETLAIGGLKTGFYGGNLEGDLHFDWSGPAKSADYRLALALTNVALHQLLADMWPKTNKLEGRVTGVGRVTSANTADIRTVTGGGTVSMRDGFLWGLPIFGLFSPLFDSISPGLGQTRFTSGTADFAFTNGVIVTDNLEMRSPTMRVQYRGNVGWDGQIDATMEAELFRDAPLIGRLLSFAFSPVTKLFEYRVKGTLGNPNPEPRYIPKFLVNLFRPIKMLKSLLPREDKPDGEDVPVKPGN